MKRLLIFLLLAVSAGAAGPWYVDSSKTGGLNNGTSPANAWTALSSIGTNMTPGDTCYIYKAVADYNVQWTIAESGTNATTRMNFIGVPDASGNRPVVRGINGVAFDYIAIIKIEITQLTTANAYDAIHWAGCDGWLVEDCYIHYTYLDGISCASSTTNSNNIIRHNTFDDIGGINGGQGGGSNPTVINLRGSTNIVEYNTVLKSMDRVRVLGGTGNVIRDNYWGATDTTLYPSSPQYPSHTDGLQSFGNIALIQLLYEKNYDVDNQDSTVGLGGPNAHGLLIQDDTSLGTFKWVLYRANLEIRTGAAGPGFERVYSTYGYNNTLIAVQNQEAGIGFTAVGYYAAAATVAFWINNSFNYSPHTVASGGSGGSIDFGGVTSATSDYTQYDATSGGVPTETHATMHSVAPLFTDGLGTAGHDNYTLQSGSPMRATGGVLTTANGAGVTQTNLTVATGSARKIFSGASGDGWAAADGDWIKIGSNAFVQVTAVNTTTDVVTLASAQSWSSGANVIVKGMEDVGALPYSYAVTFTNALVNSTLAPGANSLTSTVNSPDAVRMVEYLVDNAPVGISYDSSGGYPVSYTSDGGTHVVTSRAYNMWASATLVQESIKTLSASSAVQAIISNSVKLRAGARF